MYKNGHGTKKDYKLAFKWYQAAVAQNHLDAKNNLGVLHVNGFGTKRDFKKGVTLFREAAEQGHASAQVDLGIAYFNGRGVPPDSAIAYAWFHVAATQGDKRGYKNKAQLYKQLLKEDLKRAQKLSIEYNNKFGSYAQKKKR